MYCQRFGEFKVGGYAIAKRCRLKGGSLAIFEFARGVSEQSTFYGTIFLGNSESTKSFSLGRKDRQVM